MDIVARLWRSSDGPCRRAWQNRLLAVTIFAMLSATTTPATAYNGSIIYLLQIDDALHPQEQASSASAKRSTTSWSPAGARAVR